MKRATLVLLIFGAISNLRADTIYQFNLLDVRIQGIRDVLSGCTATAANDLGIIVGVCNNPAGDALAWSYDGRRFTEIDVNHGFKMAGDRPVFTATPHGINNNGVITGWLNVQLPGSLQLLSFMREGHSTLILGFPNATLTEANGINDYGEIVGQYRDGAKIYHGFRYDPITAKYSLIERPGAQGELGGFWLCDINNNGQMVGNTYDVVGSDLIAHGFFIDKNGIQRIDVPGAAHTYLFGINDQGAMVGIYCDDLGQNKVHGFITANGIVTVLNVPGAVRADPFSINNDGQIVGSALFEQSGQFERKAFIAKGNQ